MGHSLHNKIHLGSRNALLNVKRMKIAACIACMIGAGAALMLLKGIAE